MLLAQPFDVVARPNRSAKTHEPASLPAGLSCRCDTPSVRGLRRVFEAQVTRQVVVVDLGDRVVERPLSADPVTVLKGKYAGRGPSADAARRGRGGRCRASNTS